jgi:type I restriction enzyme R subunit
VHREYLITAGKIKATGRRCKQLIADYILSYKGRRMAVVKAKSDELHVGEGVAQAKDYAEKLQIDDAYAINDREIYPIEMDTAIEGSVEKYHLPDHFWNKAFPEPNTWKDGFSEMPYETKGGTMGGRFYQEIAVERVMDAIADR